MEFTEEVIKVKKVDSFTLDQTYTDVIASMVYKVSATVNDTTYSREAVIMLDWTTTHPNYIAYADVTQDNLLVWAQAANEKAIDSLKQMVLDDIMFYSNEPDTIVTL